MHVDQKREDKTEVQNLHVTLKNEILLEEQYDVFVSESALSAIIDTACTKTVCNRSWLSDFSDLYSSKKQSELCWEKSQVPFYFGNAPVEQPIARVTLPVVIACLCCNIETEVAERKIPLLLSKII